MGNDSSNSDDPGLLAITLSVIASFCGIQTAANHDRDNTHIDRYGFKPYIIIGIVLTLLFVALVYLVVQIVLHFAT